MVVFKSFMGVDSEAKPRPVTAEALDPQHDLLQRIKAMPHKKPVSLRDAWHIMQEDFLHTFFEIQDLDRVTELAEKHWVDCLSDLGYHIVLDGSEYEILAVA
jgi:hypothetical protein